MALYMTDDAKRMADWAAGDPLPFTTLVGLEEIMARHGERDLTVMFTASRNQALMAALRVQAPQEGYDVEMRSLEEQNAMLRRVSQRAQALTGTNWSP